MKTPSEPHTWKPLLDPGRKWEEGQRVACDWMTSPEMQQAIMPHLSHTYTPNTFLLSLGAFWSVPYMSVSSAHLRIPCVCLRPPPPPWPPPLSLALSPCRSTRFVCQPHQGTSIQRPPTHASLRLVPCHFSAPPFPVHLSHLTTPFCHAASVPDVAPVPSWIVQDNNNNAGATASSSSSAVSLKPPRPSLR